MLDLSPLWISLRIATIATLITVGLGIAAAYGMQHYRGRGRSLLDSLLLAPMVLPPTVVGFLLLIVLGRNSPLGSWLERGGLNPIFTWYAAVIAATVVAFPLMYKTMVGALEQIDPTLQQAARTLGASEWRLFCQITFPLALPGILAGTTLAFARALGEFGATLMLAGNIPGQTQTLPMAIYFAVEAGDLQTASLWTGVILALTLGGLSGVHSYQLRRTRRFNRGQPSQVQSDRLDHTAEHAFPRAIPQPNIQSHFSVTLTKQIGDFKLQVAFSSGAQPLGILGGSGAGKSLLLRCLAGIETPDTGRIVLNGRVLFDSERGINVPSRDRRIGILFQNYALFPHLTVAENIAFGLGTTQAHQRMGERGQSRLRSRVHALLKLVMKPLVQPPLQPWIKHLVEEQLALVQLQGMGDRYPNVLSGGQQQRVALARVLASQPELLLLDEPFSALDTHLRHQIERDLSLRLDRFPGLTFLVTHNIEEAYRLCNTLLILNQGQTSLQAPKALVMEHPQTVSAAQLTGCKNISRFYPLGPTAVRALDWDCTLTVAMPCSTLEHRPTHVGIRAHHLGFLEALGPFPQHESACHASQGFASSGAEMGCRSAPHLPAPRLNPETARTEELVPEKDSAALALTSGSLLQFPQDSPPAVLPPITNSFPCWLATARETPHRITLYLKLHTPAAHRGDYHLQAEVFREKWLILQSLPQPWAIVLSPERLLLLQD